MSIVYRAVKFSLKDKKQGSKFPFGKYTSVLLCFCAIIARAGKGLGRMQIRSAKDFGSAIRERRKQLKLTQPEVAGASGVGVRFIVDLERGKPTCVLEKSLHVALMLGLTLEMSNGGAE
ncbi:MAG TPA: helix-turn-helix transcriptional regulator [Candidatus Obscuribacterales bacterium]